MMCIIGGIDVGTLLQQVIVNLQRIRRGMPHCLTLLLYTLAANCAPEGGGLSLLSAIVLFSLWRKEIHFSSTPRMLSVNHTSPT